MDVSANMIKIVSNKKMIKKLTLDILKGLVAFWDIAKTLILVVAIAFLIRFYLVQPFYVEGQSMEPNFNNSEYLLIDEITYQFRDPKRGEVIVFKPPISTYQNYIKRIIGLPGETIVFKNGDVFLKPDDQDELIKISEAYIPAETRTTTNNDEEISIPEKEYFVMGDNRNQSSDSRIFGSVNKKNITGRAWFYIKMEPWKEIKFFGKKITMPKIKKAGKIQNPAYDIVNQSNGLDK